MRVIGLPGLALLFFSYRRLVAFSTQFCYPGLLLVLVLALTDGRVKNSAHTGYGIGLPRRFTPAFSSRDLAGILLLCTLYEVRE